MTTDNDVLLIQQDYSTKVMRSAVWDAVDLSWGSWTPIDTWVNINAVYPMPWGASLNIGNGDVYLVGHTSPGWLSTTAPGSGQLLAYKYSEGSRTWSGSSVVSDDPDGWIGAVTLAIDQNTGNLYAIFTKGEQSVGWDNLQTAVGIYYRMSSDEGATWS